MTSATSSKGCESVSEVMAFVRTGVLCGALLVLSGCFKYVPTQLEAMPEGQEVRVFVTRQGALELEEVSEVNGPVPSLSGKLLAHEDRDVLIQVPVARRRDGFHSVNLAQTIRVPTGEIISAERREFDALGTSLLVAGTAGLATTVVLLIMEAYGSAPSPGDDPPVDLQLFTIPIG